MNTQGNRAKTILIVEDQEINALVVANRDAGNVIKAIKKGAVDYCTKPIEPDDLLASINRLLGGVVETVGRRQTNTSCRLHLLQLSKSGSHFAPTYPA
jgi:FixJ family two-component response regulator